MTTQNTHRVLLSGLFSLSLLLAQCSGNPFTAKAPRSSRTVAARHASATAVAQWRPTLKNDIPVTKNAKVDQWIGLFQGRFKENFDRWFMRLGLYGPTIEAILKEEGVPKDLIYLAMIESGFNLSATSHASAVGAWQFINSTGRAYGLQNDFFMDDRRNLVKATRAAARHLRDLYKTYGDWYLAFAAYNAGPGTVNSAIRRTGSKDYWVHSRSRFYRQETKDYVPKILAALHIVKNYSKYGYNANNFGFPLQYDRVTVPDATDLTVIAQSSGTSVEVVRELNPHLVSGITRPGHEVEVFIPKGAKEVFKRRYAAIPEDERVSGLFHKIGRGESISSIARHYGVNKTRIAKINNMQFTQALVPGQVLRIPADKKVLVAMANRSFGSSQTSGKWTTYRVRRGDTLNRIASRYRTSVKNVASWNRLNTRSHLRVGQNIKIYQGSAGGSQTVGTFYAANTQAAPVRTRMSGVAHIIAQDQNDPVQLSMTRQEATTELPKMEAIVKDLTLASEDAPSIVRNIGEEVQPQQPVQVAAQYHTVRSGETLSRIAARYGVSLTNMRRLNGLRGDNIRPNQKLVIKDGHTLTASAAQPRTVTARPIKNVNRMIVHQTRSGDTLWKISKRYGVKITDIKKWNRLRGDTLKPNQKIRIYAAATTKRLALVKS